MFKNLTETVVKIFECIITGSFYAAVAAVVITVVLFITSTCARSWGSLWRNIFINPWP